MIYKYEYKPVKNIPKVNAHDFISFDNMTGNGFILLFRNFALFRIKHLVKI